MHDLKQQCVASAVKHSDLVTIGWAYGTSDAYLALAMLKSAGIPVHLESLHYLNANWPFAHAFGGIAIEVPGSEAPDAWEVLAGFRGNTARRWRRWQWLVLAAVVFLWIGVPPPSNGSIASARWLPTCSAAPQPA